MIRQHLHYDLNDDLGRIDFTRVHGWLCTTYWSPGVAREKVERAARNSALVIGVYSPPAANAGKAEQVAYLRVVSDRTTFAWVCDVFVEETHRGQGLARAMIRFALSHPDFQGLRRWLLATADAHAVYGGVGFAPLPHPERWMAHLPTGPAAV